MRGTKRHGNLTPHTIPARQFAGAGHNDNDVNTPNHDGGEIPRWKRRPDRLTWGDFGPDDQLGRLNLVTPDKVLQGIAEVTSDRRFCLSLPLDYPGGNITNPRRHPPVLKPTERNGRPNLNYPLRYDDPTAPDVICDDQVVLTLQYSTQWDSLSHIGQMFDLDADGIPKHVFHNGYHAGTDIIGPVRYDIKGYQSATGEASGARGLASRTWPSPACRFAP